MREPHFWRAGFDPKSREAAPLTRALLSPLAAIYAWAGARRIRTTQPAAAPLPVICVGNLTVGGAGKTPVAAALRARLSNLKGQRIATLSRGYKGRLEGPLKVDFTSHSASDVGDEPLLLSTSGEAWMGRDRVAAATAMAEDGVSIAIMDDGHQNPTLDKAFSLIVIDSDAPFGNGFVFPKGPLRERPEIGLNRAQAVILMGAGPEPQEVTAWGGPVFRARLVPRANPPLGKLTAFAGIGRPEKFFAGLAMAGGDVVEAVPFPDHHPYSEADVRLLRDLAARDGSRLITTEKDFVRLSPNQRDGVLAFPVEAVIDNAETLDALILTAIEGRP